MLNFYALGNDRLVPLEAGPEATAEAAWIDLVQPTRAEDDQVELLLGISVPTREDMQEIEISSRLYRENDALYMTAILLTGADGPQPEVAPVTFILARKRLVTVRYSEPSIFRRFAQQAQKADTDLRNADSIFMSLLEAVVDRIADILEKVGADMDAVSRELFQAHQDARTANRDHQALLGRIGRGGDLNSKARESLVSIGRLINFVGGDCGDDHPGLRERIEVMAADIRSLTDHASYLAGTTVFLLDATLGLINIEQNNIIKIVSVVSVVIMPPTLIASIYGMNFTYMPELDWRIGYPLALVAMVLAAVLPYWIFKRRGWL